MTQTIEILDDYIPVIQNIADTEGITFDAAVQMTWDNIAMEAIKSHSVELTNQIVQSMSYADQLQLVNTMNINLGMKKQ